MRSLVATAFVLLLATAASAQGREPLAPEWESLFNGQDLTGWEKIGNEKWVVEDGAIYGEGITEEYGYLATEKSYRDFHLSLRFKCEADGNSGVYLHTAFEPGTATVTEGRQVEIDRTIGHHTGGIYGDGKGWIAWPAPELETVIRPHDWNDMLIQVERAPLRRAPQRGADAGLHLPPAGCQGGGDRAAAALGGRGPHAVQGHLDSRSVPVGRSGP